MQLVVNHPIITGVGLLWIAFVVHLKAHDSPLNLMVRRRYSSMFVGVRDNLRQDELRSYTWYSAIKWLAIGAFLGIQLALGPF
jgi:hypothetical protein